MRAGLSMGRAAYKLGWEGARAQHEVPHSRWRCEDLLEGGASCAPPLIAQHDCLRNDQEARGVGLSVGCWAWLGDCLRRVEGTRSREECGARGLGAPNAFTMGLETTDHDSCAAHDCTVHCQQLLEMCRVCVPTSYKACALHGWTRHTIRSCPTIGCAGATCSSSHGMVL